MTDKIEKDLSMIVFIDNKANDEEINDIKEEIEKISNIDSITFRSKDEIKKEMSATNESFKTIMDTWKEDENPLQNTYVLKVKEIKEIKETATTIKNIDNVKLVKYGESMVDKMINVFDLVKIICIGIVGALVLVTWFLITNTIKITIFSRRHEIDIMRLVGTSNFAIKLPFQIEGFILGVIGSIIPIILTIYGYTFLYDFIGGKLFTELVVLVPPSEIVYITSLMLVIMGGILGMSGSYNSVKRYLKI
jgi:cell division transport system permease protein